MVPEKNWVQAELRVHQGHIAEPACKGVYTLLSLGKVLRVCPGGHVGALVEKKQQQRNGIDKTNL